ncbi:MAG: AAA family ATPase [Acidobacteriota bacterium]
MERLSAADVIRTTLVARHPLIALLSAEEERVERCLRDVSATTFAQPAPFYTWALTRGLVGPDGKVVKGTEDPLAALDAIAKVDGAGLFLMRDLHVHLDDPRLMRRLRDLRTELAPSFRFVFLLATRWRVPPELRRDVALVEFPLPTAEELGAQLTSHLEKADPPLEADDETQRRFVTALQGLTENEANHALNRALFKRQALDDQVLGLLYEQKEQLARKEGVLEFVPQRWQVNDIGGLDVLKEWLTKRRKLFDDTSKEVEELIPKGLLIMGISGCGKSLSIKAISSLWNLPLFRLDMGQVFSGVHGTPEEAFDRALKMMEAVAPAILWIDEIENGISAENTGADAGTKGRIFATFLTWMQEKSGRIFVAATANRIDLLPAELLRKGRFDQVFFIDLPSEAERSQIFAVHLYRRGVDPKSVDINVLAKATKNWNGAEIEQCVVSSMVEAYDKGEPVTDDELFSQIGKIVPLATTMAEQIKGIKSWAHDRAIRASEGK